MILSHVVMVILRQIYNETEEAGQKETKCTLMVWRPLCEAAMVKEFEISRAL